MTPQNEENQGYLGSDQRYLPRWEVHNRVLFKVANRKEICEGFTKDLHAAGTCLCIDESILPQQDVILTIHLSHGSSIRVKGKIVWAKTIGIKPHVGINFHSVPHDTQDQILENAFELDRENIVKHWFKGWEGKS